MISIRQYMKLFEAPIEDVNLIGDWNRNSSFRHTQDRKILNNPRAQEQLIHKWRNTVVPFNMYFVNSPEANRHTEEGEVSLDWLAQNMPKTLPQLNLRDDAINLIYTNNKGTERAPMTAWVIAHRMGHTMNRLAFSYNAPDPEFTQVTDLIHRTASQILDGAYGIKGVPRSSREGFRARGKFDNLLKNFFQAIGTMRSSRSKNLRAYFEFQYELLAQYVTTNRVSFNPLPSRFRYGQYGGTYAHLTRNEHDAALYNEMLTDLAETLPEYFDEIFRSSVGKIYVM